MGMAGQGCDRAQTRGGSTWEQEGLTPATFAKVAHPFTTVAQHIPPKHVAAKKNHTWLLSFGL